MRGFERSRLQGYLFPLLVFLLALGMFSLQWGVAGGTELGMIFGDVTVTAAERVLAGDVPYRDFWTMYAPGSFYLLAFLFSLFGVHVTVGSVAASVLSAGSITLCYLLVDQLLRNRLAAFACAAIFFAAFYSTGYYLSLGPYPPVVLSVFLALILIARYYRTDSLAYLFAAGLLAGLAIVFKHDVGAYTGIAITAGILAGYFAAGPDSSGGVKGLVFRILVFAAAAGLVFLPVTIYFARLAGYDMWYDLIVFPATDFKYARTENYPGLLPGDFSHDWWLMSVFSFFDYLQFTLPFLLFAMAVVTLFVSVLRHRREFLPITVTLCVLFLLHYLSAHVQVNTNIISMSVYAAILGAISFHQITANRSGGYRMLLSGTAISVAAVIFGAFFAQPFYNQLFSEQPQVAMTLPKVRGIRVSPEKNEAIISLASYIDEHVPPDKRIFIGLNRHDVTVIGDGKMYFILDRLNATRHDQLHPGIVDTEKVQREIIRDLQKNDARVIILRHVFPDKELDEFKVQLRVYLPKSGASLLDEYIHSNYTRVHTVGMYEIWERIAE